MAYPGQINPDTSCLCFLIYATRSIEVTSIRHYCHMNALASRSRGLMATCIAL